jgi:transcriptional regulator with XRE-family HTH domain/integrase
MQAPAWAVVDRELAGSVEAGGIVVAIWRAAGRRTLLLEAVMPRRSRTSVRPVDSGTADVNVARERASAFAEKLLTLEEAGITGDDQVQNTSYDELMKKLVRGTDASNRKTQLNAWMRIFGFQLNDVIGDEFGAAFNVYAQKFRDRLEQEGKAPSTICSYLSRMRDIRQVAVGIRYLNTQGLTFATALDAAIRSSGRSEIRIAAAIGVSNSTVNNWRRGLTQPPEACYPKVVSIEMHLGLRVGTLTELLPPLRPECHRVASPFTTALREAVAASGLATCRVADALGVSRSTLSAWVHGQIPGPRHRGGISKLEEVLGAKPGLLVSLLPPLPPSAYSYTAKLTRLQEAQWEALFLHKTMVDEPDESRRAQDFWRVRSDGTCSTAGRARRALCDFFGCLALPTDAEDERFRGLGLAPESLSLLNFANLHQVQFYLRFRKARAGAYNKGTMWFIMFACSLLRPGTGFLAQGNDVDWRTFPVKDLQKDVTVSGDGPTIEAWRAHCADVRAKLMDWRKYLKRNKLVKRSRDFSHIEAILRDDAPAKILVLLERRMRAYTKKRWHFARPLERAMLARDLLLVCLINENPLRRNHWRIMTWTPDGRGHLFKRRDGNYSVRFRIDEFKDVTGLPEGEDYEAEVSPVLTPMIDEYLTVHRPLLIGADECDLVFRPTRPTPDGECGEPMKIGLRLATLTRRYVPEYAPRGFNPHAWRHILATDLVKNHDAGVRLAADALLNTERMIEEYYGHLSSTDRTRRAHRVISETLEKGARALDEEDT